MHFKLFVKAVVVLLIVTSIACEKINDQAFTNSAISTAHPLATNAGLEMYKQGGNAFDASVAAAFAHSGRSDRVVLVEDTGHL